MPTSPITLASESNDILVARTGDPLDSVACENIARAMSSVYDMGIGFSAWLANRQDHIQVTALNQLTIARDLGLLLSTKTANELPEVLADLLGENNVFVFMNEGTIKEITLNTQGGFDDGTTVIEDVNDPEKKLSIRFINENLVMYDKTGVAITTVPVFITSVSVHLFLNQLLFISSIHIFSV